MHTVFYFCCRSKDTDCTPDHRWRGPEIFTNERRCTLGVSNQMATEYRLITLMNSDLPTSPRVLNISLFTFTKRNARLLRCVFVAQLSMGFLTRIITGLKVIKLGKIRRRIRVDSITWTDIRCYIASLCFSLEISTKACLQKPSSLCMH